MVASNNGISAAIGSLNIARHPSTKAMRKTANWLAYSAGLQENTVEM